MTEYDEFQVWIKKINNEILDISNAAEVWRRVIEIENNSSHFKRFGKHFQRWQEQNYSYRMVLQITRLVEPTKNKDGLSLYRFLEQLRDTNHISFERYKKTFGGVLSTEEKVTSLILNSTSENGVALPYTIETAIKWFEDITSQSKDDKCFCICINNDIEKLNKINESLKKYRNKHIAHFTSTKVTKIPTYNSIDESITQLQEIGGKYNLLLLNSNQVFKYYDLDVKSVFKKSWIDSLETQS